MFLRNNIRIIIKVFLSFFLTLQVFSQEQNVVFDKINNQAIVNKEGKSPYVYKLVREKFTIPDSEKYEKRLSSFYKKVLAFKNRAEADSVKISELKKASKPIVDLDENEVNYRLKLCRRTLKRTKKYEYVKVKDDFYYKLKISRSVFKPENSIIGEFKVIGLFYVVKNANSLTESNLISVEEVKKNGLTTENFLFKNKFNVIQSLSDSSYYMVSTDFIKKFAVTNIAITLK